MIIEKGQAVPLLGQLCGQLPFARCGRSSNANQNDTTANASDASINVDTANNATQTPPSAGPSTSDHPCLGPGTSYTHWRQPSSSGSFVSALDFDDDDAFFRHFQSSGTVHHRSFRFSSSKLFFIHPYLFLHAGFLDGGASLGQTASSGQSQAAPSGQTSAFTVHSK